MTWRPRKIIYVTAGLRGGGAEAMLTRLATAQPGVADEIIVASLLPAEGHIERLAAAGVKVVELRFDRLGGAAAGLFKLAKLIVNCFRICRHAFCRAIVELGPGQDDLRPRRLYSVSCCECGLRGSCPICCRSAAPSATTTTSTSASPTTGSGRGLSLRSRRSPLLTIPAPGRRSG